MVQKRTGPRMDPRGRNKTGGKKMINPKFGPRGGRHVYLRKKGGVT